MSSTNYCLICGRLSSSSSTSSSQKNNKIINQFDLHQVFKIPLLDCTEFFSSSSLSSFCVRCSSLLFESRNFYTRKSNMETELTGIKYSLINGLVNDDCIQSREDLTQLKQVFIQRFILFQKLREILQLDPREPRLSPQDVIVAVDNSENNGAVDVIKKCIICGDTQDHPDPVGIANNNTSNVLTSLETVHPTLHTALTEMYKDKEELLLSLVSFCQSCSFLVLIRGHSCLHEISTQNETLEKIEFQLLDRLFNHKSKVKVARHSSSSSDINIKRCLLVEKAKIALSLKPPSELDDHQNQNSQEREQQRQQWLRPPENIVLNRDNNNDEDEDENIDDNDDTITENLEEVEEYNTYNMPNDDSIDNVNEQEEEMIDIKPEVRLSFPFRYEDLIHDGYYSPSTPSGKSDSSSVEYIPPYNFSSIEVPTGSEENNNKSKKRSGSSSSRSLVLSTFLIDHSYAAALPPSPTRSVLNNDTQHNLENDSNDTDDYDENTNTKSNGYGYDDLFYPKPGPSSKLKPNFILPRIIHSQGNYQMERNDGNENDYDDSEGEDSDDSYHPPFLLKQNEQKEDSDNSQDSQYEPVEYSSDSDSKGSDYFVRKRSRKRTPFSNINTKIRERSFMCLLCDHKCSGPKSSLLHYQVVHNSPTSWPCNDANCSLIFENKDKLYNHRRSVHRNLPVNIRRRGQGQDRSIISTKKVNMKRKRVVGRSSNYMCLICDRKFSNQISVTKHYQSGIHGSYPLSSWPCAQCPSIEFTNRDALYGHRNTFHCNLPINYQRNLKTPTIKKRNYKRIQRPPSKKFSPSFMCLLCDLRFTDAITVHRHYINFHGNGKPVTSWPCNFPGCGKVFESRSRDNLYQHRRRVHKNLPLNMKKQRKIVATASRPTNQDQPVGSSSQEQSQRICVICDSHFLNGLSYNQHQSSHRHLKVLPCIECGLEFNVKEKLLIHRKYVHKWNGGSSSSSRQKKKLKKIKTIPSKPIFDCLLCNKTCKDIFAGRRHYATFHPSVTEWKCYFCSKIYKTKASLALHRRIHHKDGIRREHDEDKAIPKPSIKRKYICAICNIQFHDRHQICHHYSTQHLNTTDWKCYFCPSSYNTRRSLIRHRKRHHSDLPPITSTIPSPTPSPSNTTTTTATNIQPQPESIIIICVVCQEDISKKNIDQHYKEQHPDLPTHLRCFKCKVIYSNYNVLFEHQKNDHDLLPRWNREKYDENRKRMQENANNKI